MQYSSSGQNTYKNLVNLPIGALTMVVIAFILKPMPAAKPGQSLKQQFKQLDPLGSLFLLPSIICLLLALQWGGSTYAWSDGKIIALLVVFAVLFIAWILVQVFMQTNATVPARIIKNRSIIAAMLFVWCTGSCMMIFVYYIPIWFQAIKGVSAVRSGIDTIPMVLSVVVGTISGGQITGRLGYYTPLAYVSVVLAPIGAGLISTFSVTTGHSMWIGYQVLFGLGIGIGMQQGMMAAQTVLPRSDVPSGVSLILLAQLLGGAIFLSVGQQIFTSNLVSRLSSLVPGLDPAMIVNTGATELRTRVSAEQLSAVLEAYNYALRQVFLVGTGLGAAAAIGAFALEWKSVKKAPKGESNKPEEEKAESGEV